MDKRAFRMEIKELEATTGTFVGYLSTFGNTDQQGDVVEKGAFARTLDRWRQKGKPMPLLWQHQEVIGGIDAKDALEDEHGLLVKGQLVLDLQKAREVLALLKAGVVNAMSIGYDVIQHTRDGAIRKLKELRLYEGSLVLWPANEAAEVLAVKAVVPFQDLSLADENQGWDAGKARGRIRSYAMNTEGEVDWTKYKKGFLWWDPDAADTTAGYKFPVADVIDGNLKAIPRAIFAAAGVVQGGRGGANTSTTDVPKIKNHLARYYSKLERTPPWEAANEQAALAEETQALYWLAQSVAFSALNMSKGRTPEITNFTDSRVLTFKDASGTNYIYDTTAERHDSATWTDHRTGTVHVEPIKARALSAEMKAKLKEAADALHALLDESDVPDADVDPPEPGTQNLPPDSGDSPSEDEELQQLLGEIRSFTDTLQRRTGT